MMKVRAARDRFHTEIDWLDSWHCFSFGHHHDPRFMGFRALRVINDDRVKAGRGFGTHSHRDAEILSWVLEGALEHKDSMGTGSIIRPGEAQYMCAGTGVSHSEWNHSKTEPVHFMQIWLLPDRAGHRPSYAQTAFPAADRRGRLCLLASGDGRDGSLAVHQDVSISTAIVDPGVAVELPLRAGRSAWVQVAKGAVRIGELELVEGDGVAVTDESRLTIEGRAAGSEVLTFDLA